MLRNIIYLDNMLAIEGLRALQRLLPPGWTVKQTKPAAPKAADDSAEIMAPDGRRGLIKLEARQQLEPRGVSTLVEAAREQGVSPTLVVIARYLSEGTRTRLQERQVGYIDLTGNVRIELADPGVFIWTHGATEDPNREERPARSLRGAKTGRIVRALIDHAQPPGVRELAEMTHMNAGYVSRVLAFLDTEALIVRVGHGRTQSVDWPALLRRWARDAPLESRGTSYTYLEPRGLPTLVARLAKSRSRYAMTGSLAAATFAPVAPPRLATIWIRDAVQAAKTLDLRATEAGANVLLIDPGDEIVFEGAAQRENVWYAAPSQVAADLLTSPGRGPAEGEELIQWMLTNERVWRR